MLKKNDKQKSDKTRTKFYKGHIMQLHRSLNKLKIEPYDLASHNMSFECKRLVKNSNFRQVELRLISNYRDLRKHLHNFCCTSG